MARPRLHMALVDPALVAAILAGDKTCEARLSRRAHPARLARPGDRLLARPVLRERVDALICALATIRRVDSFAGLAPGDLAGLRALYGDDLGDERAVDAYFADKREAAYAVFLRLIDARAVALDPGDAPGNRLAWVADWRPPGRVARLLRR